MLSVGGGVVAGPEMMRKVLSSSWNPDAAAVECWRELSGNPE